jgi:hypothetical protein
VDAIDFNTVDGFQGQEKEIIIFSCVRAGSGIIIIIIIIKPPPRNYNSLLSFRTRYWLLG